jgi:hypothetical protein
MRQSTDVVNGKRPSAGSGRGAAGPAKNKQNKIIKWMGEGMSLRWAGTAWW